ncbi:MAG: hypothetical protein HW421_2807 [Ignavibacteria bacterium]|nr:hypothetical protein [Ignavibacteria bacterium]
MKSILIIALLFTFAILNSCKEDSNPLPSENKITVSTFSPTSGYANSQVTLYGKNLLLDSLVNVFFNDKTAKIISKSNDSLVIFVPDSLQGEVRISIQFSKNKYVYGTKFVVQKPFFDYSGLNRFEMLFKNLHIIYRDYYYYQYKFDPPYSSEYFSELYNYRKNFTGNFTLKITELNQNEFNMSCDGYLLSSNLKFKVDEANKKIIYLDYKEFGRVVNTDPYITETWSMKINLRDVTAEFYPDSLIQISLVGKGINSFIDTLNFTKNGANNRPYHHDYYIREIKQLLPSTDSTSLIFKIYK